MRNKMYNEMFDANYEVSVKSNSLHKFVEQYRGLFKEEFTDKPTEDLLNVEIYATAYMKNGVYRKKDVTYTYQTPAYDLNKQSGFRNFSNMIFRLFDEDITNKMLDRIYVDFVNCINIKFGYVIVGGDNAVSSVVKVVSEIDLIEADIVGGR